MSTLAEAGTRTVSALYEESAAAERAVAELLAIGVSGDRVALRSGREGALAAEGATGKAGRHGFFAALGEFLMPESDRWYYAQGLDRGATLVIARDLSPEEAAKALDVLDREGIDLEEASSGMDEIDRGAIGAGGEPGAATGEFDRLTGERIGAPREAPGGRRAPGPHRRARAYVREDDGS